MPVLVMGSWNSLIQEALTHVKHFKGLFCALNFYLCGSTDVHVVVLIFTHDLGLKGPGEREREEGGGMKEGTVLL